MMSRQETIVWPSPVSIETKRRVSFDCLKHYKHLKPLNADGLVITDLSEILNSKLPCRVTKHAASRHVRQFRDDGTLKLGTFREYRESDDPANQDPTEGQLYVWIEQSDYTYHDIGVASDRYKMFCTSLTSTKTNETSGYGDSRFTIEDLPGFISAIAQEAGLSAIAMTSCIYRNSRVLQVQDSKTQGIPNPLTAPTQIQTYAQIGLSFIKPETHAEHAEFRFLWYDRHGKVSPDGIISCPSARQYCSFS